MQITFSYPSGRRVVAGVLAVGADFIRIVSPRRNEGFDIYLRDQDWITDTGKTIRMDAIVLGNGTRLPSAVPRKRGQSRRKPINVSVAGAPGS